MKQPWHTEGYDKLASASMYLALSQAIENISLAEMQAALRVLIEAGRAIQKEFQ